jgi:hypothetical protein
VSSRVALVFFASQLPRAFSVSTITSLSGCQSFVGRGI